MTYNNYYILVTSSTLYLPYLFHSVSKVFWTLLNCFVILLEVIQMIYWNCYHSSVFTIGVLSTPKIVFFLFWLLRTLFQRKRKGKLMNLCHKYSKFGIWYLERQKYTNWFFFVYLMFLQYLNFTLFFLFYNFCP